MKATCRLIVGIRKEDWTGELEGHTEIPCNQCQATILLSPAGQALLEILELAAREAVCIPCAAGRGIEQALRLYQSFYGHQFGGTILPTDDLHALALERNQGARESFRGPKCSHPARIWTPVISVHHNGVLMGRHWIPGNYCDDCAKTIKTEDFRNAVARAIGKLAPEQRPGELWQLVWVKPEQLPGLLRPPADVDLHLNRRLNG